MSGAVLAALAVGLWGAAQDRAAGASAGGSVLADRPVSREIVRELPELRTRTSRTYLTADGGHLAELSTAPVNFREDGRWKPIDTTLEPDAAGVLRNRAGDYGVALPEDLRGTVRLGHGGRSVGFRLKDAAGERSSRGPSAIYRAAQPSLDVRYDVLADGLKETLVLKDREAPRRLRFALELSDGLRAVSTERGGLEVRGTDGETRFAMPAPVAWDAASGSTPSESPVRMSYDPDAREIELRVADDYLDDSARRFPVSVDPWIVVQPPVRDCTLSARSGEQQTSFCGTDLLVGKVGGAEHRTVLHFDAIGQLPRHATVLNAYVKLHQKSQDGTAWEDWTVHGLTRPWANNEVSWQQATTATAWATPGGDIAPALDPVKRLGGGDAGVDTFWPVDEQVIAAADASAPDHGLLIKAAGADPATGLVFASGEDPDPAKRPKLSIYYEPVMGTDGPFSFVYENLGSTRSGVNVASGRLTVTDTDASVSPGPPAFDLQRHYNSADERSNKLGLSWRLDAYAKLEIEAHATSVHMPSGTALRFARRDDDTYATARGSDAQLTETSTGHVLDLGEPQQRLHFDTNERLVKREDIATGQHITYAYNSHGRIATVTDAAQGTATVNYDPTWGIITSIDLPDGRTVTYDVRSNFLRSRTIDGATTEYRYDANDRLERIIAPEGTVKFVYDGEGRVTSMTRVTDAVGDTGPTTSFTFYGRANLGDCTAGSIGRTVETMPDGRTVTYCYNAALEVLEQAMTGAGETPEVQDIAAEAYAAEYGVSLAAAQEALALSDRAVGLGDDVAQALAGGTGFAATSDDYGGVWFDNGQRRVGVAITAQADSAPVEAVMAARGLDSSNSDIVRVTHPQSALEAERDRILTALDDLVTAELLVASFRASENDVLVEVASDMTAGERARVDAEVDVATTKVTVVASTQPRFGLNPLRCSVAQCDPPLRGGIGLRLDGTRYCTGAFTARQLTQRVLVTAGHCKDVWGTDDDVEIRDSAGDTSVLGRFDPFAYQGTQGDFGMVRVTDGSRYDQARGTVYVAASRDQGDYLRDGGRTRRNPSYRITRLARNQLGAPICLTGTRSGTKCGLIVRTGLSIGRRTYRLAQVQLWNCREYETSDDELEQKMGPGDSGGPGYKYGAAMAIISSGRDHTPRDKTDAANPSCNIFVGGAKEAESVMDVTIDTQ